MRAIEISSPDPDGAVEILVNYTIAMKNDEFDGFAVNLFLDEDGDYLAHFVEMPNVSAFSDTPEGALKELAVAWKGIKESYRKHNEPIPQAQPREKTVRSRSREPQRVGAR